MSQVSYFPLLLFNIASLLGLGMFIGVAIVRKSIPCLLCFAGLFLSNFMLPFIVGEMLFRAAQGFCFFVAGVVLCALYLLDKHDRWKWIHYVRKTAYILAVLLILLQAADLNKWFYNDYIRYKKEEFALHSIATRLIAECDISKPVVFTNPDHESYLYEKADVNQVNGNSMLIWGLEGLDAASSRTMIDIFKLHGYDFIQSPTAEQAERGHLSSETMEAWPKRGSIQEFDDYIVVNFAEKTR